MLSTGLSRSMPERSKPAFQSRRCRSTHRRPLSRSRRCRASRMCSCASIRRGMPRGLLEMMKRGGRPHQHAGGLLGQQQHAVVRGLADQLVELGVELGHGGRIALHLARLVDVGGERGQVLLGRVVHGLIDGGRLQRARGVPQLAERHLLQDQRAASCGWRGDDSAAPPPTGGGSARARRGPTARAGGCPRARSSG